MSLLAVSAPGSTLRPPQLDLACLRSYRLERIRAQLRSADAALCVLTNPVNLRYAVDHREYQLFQSRIPSSVLFVPVEGPVVMHGASERSLETIDEHRPSPWLTAFDGGLDLSDRSRRFAASVMETLRDIGVHDPHPRIAIERAAPSLTEAFLQAGLELIDADSLLERAKSIKSPEEILCLRHAIAVAERAMDRMRLALVPGITENQLWSILHQVNIAHDGDWCDGRMLASGSRTNPWLQEARAKVIESGELVAFDTDMIGPMGYCADISRTWLCGPAAPTAQQRDLYRHAHDEVQHNLDLIVPGLSFRELSERAFPVRDEFVAHRYPCLAHGVGMSDEWPKIHYRQDWERSGYDGVIEAGMVLCIESFTGSDRGGEGVKLEQCARVTETGTELLSDYPFEAALLGSDDL